MVCAFEVSTALFFPYIPFQNSFSPLQVTSYTGSPSCPRPNEQMCHQRHPPSVPSFKERDKEREERGGEFFILLGTNLRFKEITMGRGKLGKQELKRIFKYFV